MGNTNTDTVNGKSTGKGTGVSTTEAELREALARLQAENEALKARKGGSTTNGLKVAEKGGISLYGLGRFPVTLFSAQWFKLLDMADEIRAFIKANANDPRVVAAQKAHEERKAAAKAQ